MRRIYIENKKCEYDIRELAKVFLPPEDYGVIVRQRGEAQSPAALTQEPGLQVEAELLAEEGAPADIFLVGTEKNEIKRQLYCILSAETGYEPPWGTLTGVRPLKLLDQCEPKMLKQEYLISDAKIDLLIEIHENQKRFFERRDVFNRQVGIYVGIPFCPTRCAYCSFPAAKIDEEAADAYLDALEKEAESVGRMIAEQGILAETVYIGGGTPTSLTEAQMERLFSFLKAHLPVAGAIEFTVEAGRPDTVTAEKLEIIRKHGGDRISINPQTMKDETLSLIGRRHTAGDVRRAAAMAKEAGIPVVNMDMIAGLPGENAEDFARSLEEVVALMPQNITVHTLAIKKSSRFKEEHVQSKPEEVQAMVNFSRQALLSAGYVPYYLYRQKYMSANLENVGYCFPGTENGYNIRIMEEKQTIIAIGAGGISKFYFPSENRLERVPNVSNYEVYIERIDEMIRRKLDFI